VPLTVKTTISPDTMAVFSFWPALNRPWAGSSPRRVTAHCSQRRSSSSKRSISRAAPRNWRPFPGRSAISPAQKAIAAPRWMDFHIPRLAATSASEGR
jgi:hypothetical protein